MASCCTVRAFFTVFGVAGGGTSRESIRGGGAGRGEETVGVAVLVVVVEACVTSGLGGLDIGGLATCCPEDVAGGASVVTTLSSVRSITSVAHGNELGGKGLPFVSIDATIGS